MSIRTSTGRYCIVQNGEFDDSEGIIRDPAFHIWDLTYPYLCRKDDSVLYNLVVESKVALAHVGNRYRMLPNGLSSRMNSAYQAVDQDKVEL